LTLVAIVLAVVLVVLSAWWWFVRCERNCGEVLRHAQDMFERGELSLALARIDAVDAKCHCSRFTSGDAPPQYSLAQACLERLLSEGRLDEVERLLAQAQGPILKELGKRNG
jgi:hypothetical protein